MKINRIKIDRRSRGKFICACIHFSHMLFFIYILGKEVNKNISFEYIQYCTKLHTKMGLIIFMMLKTIGMSTLYHWDLQFHLYSMVFSSLFSFLPSITQILFNFISPNSLYIFFFIHVIHYSSRLKTLKLIACIHC